MSGLPISLMVRRYQCPHCPRRRAKKAAIAEHIGRCWRNPDARGCLTCSQYDEGDYGDPTTGYPGFGPSCAQGVSLEGRLACPDCGGFGSTVDGDTLGVTECGTCSGDSAEIKAGPIVHCSVDCPTCAAVVGTPCTQNGGRDRYQRIHVARTKAAREAL